MRNVRGIRLLWQDSVAADHLRDFASVSEAREAVPSDASNWVIFELVNPGKYAECGQVLDSGCSLCTPLNLPNACSACGIDCDDCGGSKG